MLCCRRNRLGYRFEQSAKNPPTFPTRTKGPPEKQADDEQEAFVCGLVPRYFVKFVDGRSTTRSTTYSVVIPIV